MKHTLIVGDEWLYFKIYTGYKTADSLLISVLKPVIEFFFATGHIKKWFFIRYGDPNHHLRVRFLCTNSYSMALVISKLNGFLNTYVTDDLVWKIQIDTYNREIERYGKNFMELTETIFYIDSVCILDFLNLIDGKEDEEIRWLFGLRSVDLYLDIFRYELTDKLKLIKNLRTSFVNEFEISRPVKKQLDSKYRKKREIINFFMNITEKESVIYAPIIKILHKKREYLENTADIIIAINKSDIHHDSLDNLLNSYIHMFMNRLFKSKNRLNEMVSYDFLYRYYDSKIAFQKYQ